MIVEKQKARATLLARRKRGIIISLIAVVLLTVVAVIVTPYLNTSSFEDADGVKYSIRYKKGEYLLYDANGVEITRESTYNYFVTENGTLINLDTSTGKYEVIGVPDLEESENAGHNNRVLIFPHLEKANISSLEVHNSHGSFKFLRYSIADAAPDNSGDFVIDGAPLTTYDQDLFASLYVSAGYTLTIMKIDEPIKDENGEFSEYGLVSELRVNDEGEEYLHEPAYYIITDLEGNSHKLLIGDRMVTGGGYYVQYVALDGETERPRDAVYVLAADIADSLLQPIEAFVSPTIVQGISLNNYYDVEDFNLFKYDANGEKAENIVGFTFIPLEEREGTIESSKPFVFDNSELTGYIPNSDAIFEALMNFYSPEFEGVVSFAPSDEDFVKYGLGRYTGETDAETGLPEMELSPRYAISFLCDPLDESGSPSGATLRQVIFISDKNEAGNYYVYTFFYDGSIEGGDLLYTSNMISEIKGHCLEFVTWKQSKWINKTYIDLNIAFCDTLKLESPDYSATFKLDNSKSDMSTRISSEHLKVTGDDSAGNSVDTFSILTVTDTKGYVWTITPTNITAKNSAGETVSVSSSYHAYNAIGRNVKVISGYIDCADGRQVRVHADTVSVTERDGSVTTYVRYASTLFRLYYQTMLLASIVDTYELSDEEEAALIADESKLLLTITLTKTENAYGNKRGDREFPEDFTTTYKFYAITSRKAYIVIDGVGGFYVNTSRINKIINDTQKFFALEPITATDKN